MDRQMWLDASNVLRGKFQYFNSTDIAFQEVGRSVDTCLSHCSSFAGFSEPSLWMALTTLIENGEEQAKDGY